MIDNIKPVIIFLCISCISMLAFPLLIKSDSIVSHSLNFDSTEILVATPFGLAPKSKIHYVDPRHYVRHKLKTVQIVNKESEVTLKEFHNIIKSNNYKSKSNFLKSNNQFFEKNSDFKNGWISFVIFSTNEMTTNFSTDYIVPSAPNIKSNQIIYIFSGIGYSDSVSNTIIQPVLQWGESPAGGGKYWAICNWYVTKTDFFHDSVITVLPGKRLQGQIELISHEKDNYNYLCSFKGFPTSLMVKNVPLHEQHYFAFETFFAKDCDEYPNQQKVEFFNIEIKSNDLFPQVSWGKLGPGKEPLNKCGTYSEIINLSSKAGQVDIHFSNKKETYEEIRIFPYFVKDKLKVFPSYIEDPVHIYPQEPIHDCKIEVFNITGNTIWANTFKSMETDFDIDLSNLRTGIYIIRFSYNQKSHSFKIMKL